MSYMDGINWNKDQNLGFGSSVGTIGLPGPAQAANRYTAVPSSGVTSNLPDPMQAASAVMSSSGPQMSQSALSGAMNSASGPRANTEALSQSGGLLGGLNWGNAGSILDGIGKIGAVWAAIQANKISRDSLDFQKDSFKKNLANQTKSYNTALEGRASLIHSQQGDMSGMDDYMKKNKL